MATTPSLKVVLLANNVEVASTNDSGVWLATMAAITGAASPFGDSASGPPSTNRTGGDERSNDVSNPKDALDSFAEELEIKVDQLVGAASPSMDPPYIHLDHKYWEALKQNTPPRGVGSVPGVVLAATLLLLWNRHAKFGKVGGAMCDAVLATIGHEEKNRARSLKGCEWIQVREDGLRLNPASTSSALRLTRAYATRTAPK